MDAAYGILFLACTCAIVTATDLSFDYASFRSKYDISTRVRRESPNDTLHFLEPCCSYKTVYTEEDDRIFQECFTEVENKYQLNISYDEEPETTTDNGREIFTEQEMNIFRNRSLCYPQCYLQKANAADSEGNIIAAEAIKLMKSAIPFTDEKFWTAVERICTKVPPNPDKFHICKEDAMNFKFCVSYMADMHCPENLQRKSKACDDYRLELKKRYGEN
ncbi:uncharacterized protein LOC110835251 [Zootermopsis nevadensis]|uniref:Odorant-binding protein n=1 Tax=Zootermopsis nevadensis TaxID=136037 RepID=A0A067QUA2_ZOONE|nr:uncharacterized protein LOC110835251 [Zootermopsis nevadensis]KDR13608.1 hypothetical protein L798_12434 [Zootermopsis nevadensis]